MAEEDGSQQLYWDDETQRYYKFDAEKEDYYTDDETRAADEAAAQEAAEAAGGGVSEPADAAVSRASSRQPSRAPSRQASTLQGLQERRASFQKLPSSAVPHSPSLTGPSENAAPADAPQLNLFRSGSGAAVEKTPNAREASAGGEPDKPAEAQGASLPSPTLGASANGRLGTATLSPLLTRGLGSSRSGFMSPEIRLDGEPSLAGRRGGGVAAAATDAVAAAHELEMKKKEIQGLQDQLSTAEKRIADLTVRLMHAEQGMTDDERVATLTRERDQLSLQLKQQEDDIATLEEGLEAAAVEKETALLQAERNKELAADIKLQYENLLIDKELEIANLREEFARQQVELRDSQRQHLDMQQLRERILHYDKTFVQLKQLLLEVCTQKNAKEEEANALLEFKNQANERIDELEVEAAEDAQLLQTYEDQHKTQMGIIDSQQQILERLVAQLHETNTARLTFQQAFDRLSHVFKEKEAKNRAAMEELQTENRHLRAKTEQLQSLTAPRWQRVYTLKNQAGARLRGMCGAAAAKLAPSGVEALGDGSEAREGGDPEEGETAEGDAGDAPLPPAAAEDVEAAQVQVASLSLQSAQKTVLLGCRDEKLRLLRLALPEEYAGQIERSTEGVLSLHAGAYNCFLYLNHIHAVYIQPLFADATANPRSIVKEQGFIRWLVSSVLSVSRLGRALSLFLYHLRTWRPEAAAASPSPLEQLGAPNGSAYPLVVSALRQTTKLLESASACTLSASFSLDVVDDLCQSLAALLPSSLAPLVFERHSATQTTPEAAGDGAQGANGAAVEDAAGGEVKKAILSLLPWMFTALHTMRALAFLGVVASCAVEAADAGSRQGVEAANLNAALDARQRWAQLVAVASSALGALPPPLPAALEGVDGVLLDPHAEQTRGGAANTIDLLVARRERQEKNASNHEQEGSASFGAWMLMTLHIEERRAAESPEGEQPDKSQQASQPLPSLEETLGAVYRVKGLLAEAAELQSAKFIPDRSFQTLLAFAAALDPTQARGPPSLRTRLVGDRVWQKASAGVRARVAEAAQVEKTLAELREEDADLKAQLQQQEATLAEKQELTDKWERLYSSARPKAEKYDQLENEFQRILKEKSSYVHMLDAARRRIEQHSTEAHQLRHDKRELSIHLQELNKRLEALRKVSLSAATGGGDSEQIQMLRNIIRKQELELLDVRLAGAAKQIARQELDVLETLQELSRGGTDRISRASSSLSQDLRAEDSLPVSSQASLKFGVHFSSFQQRALVHQQTLKMQIEEVEADALDISGPEAGVQMLDEYRRLQNAVLLHAFQIPIWNPSAPPDENRAKLRKYRNEHDALQLQMLSLTKRIDRLFARLAGGVHGGFGDHANLSTSRYIRQFTSLANVVSPASCAAPALLSQLSSSPLASAPGEARVAKGEESLEGLEEANAAQRAREAIQSVATLAVQKTPVMRVTLPGEPEWLKHASATKLLPKENAAEKGNKGAPSASAGARAETHFVQKLVVTEEQLAELYRKIAGL